LTPFAHQPLTFEGLAGTATVAGLVGPLRAHIEEAEMSTTTAYSDMFLMVQVRDGNSAVFDVLVQRYRRDLVGYLYRMVQNHAVAEDLAQETFLRAYRSRAGYQPTAKLTSWLYSIATRLAWNWARDNRVRQHEPLDGTIEDGRPRQIADSSPTVESALMRADRVRVVRQAIAALPERQRSVVVMHRYHEMTYEEIAAALDCSPQAVKSLLFRAHSSLRERLLHSFAVSA
jgi:RNA polymerase sigma-70 factor (ECF subfamily)